MGVKEDDNNPDNIGCATLKDDRYDTMSARQLGVECYDEDVFGNDQLGYFPFYGVRDDTCRWSPQCSSLVEWGTTWSPQAGKATGMSVCVEWMWVDNYCCSRGDC